MAYYSKGHNIDDEADDFDEYDPTPYGGGYDIHMTYGHPLPPSDEICHPRDYSETAEYTSSYADVSGYDNEDAINAEYSSYTRRPGYEYGSGSRKSEYEEEVVVVDEYERTEFQEQVSYEQEAEEIQGYGRSEEDQYIYGARKNYGADNCGGEEDEEKEHHHRTYYDD